MKYKVFRSSRFLSFYRFLAASNAKDKDEARREVILNILLLSFMLLSFVASIEAVIAELFWKQKGKYLEVVVILLILLACYLISRIGKARIIAYMLILLIFSATTYGLYRWGADLPQGLLTYALVIVTSGILISSRFSFLITILTSVSLIVLTFFQVGSVYRALSYWKSTQLTIGDSFVAAVTLAVIAIVSWLFNRETESALKRAQKSETALLRQKEQLEVLVEKRTEALKQAQIEKLTQLNRFAQFGRISSGLFHELVNPLNLVSLNLNRLRKQSSGMDIQNLSAMTILINRALSGTQRLEEFVEAARKQIQNQEVRKTFSLQEEIAQAINILDYKAKKSKITIAFIKENDVSILSNPLKFSQLISNLLVNAIDAYEGSRSKNKRIEVRMAKAQKKIVIEIQDWGSGIRKKDLSKVFDPLFTTKPPTKGMGIGLSICRDIVEKDLHGRCSIESQPGVGTTIRIIFPSQKSSRLKI